MPVRWAVDIYKESGSVRQLLKDFSGALGRHGAQPITLLETDNNDGTVATDLNAFLQESPVTTGNFINLDGIVQWSSFTNADVEALNTTTSFSNYRNFIGSRRLKVSNNNANAFRITDRTCNALTSGTCTIAYDVRTAPTGKVRQITVSSSGNPTAVMYCGPGNYRADNATWIQPNLTYTFRSYLTNTCSDAVGTLTPEATSTFLVQ